MFAEVRWILMVIMVGCIIFSGMMKNKRCGAALIGCWMSVALAPLVVADEGAGAAQESKAAAGDVATAKEQIGAATAAYDRKNAAFMRKLREFKDREKMMEFYRNNRPKPDAVVDLVLKLAKEAPKAEGVEEGLVWSLRSRNPEQRKAVSEFFLTHYKNEKSLTRLAQAMRFDQAMLERILKEAGDETVKQSATYYLSQRRLSTNQKEEALAMLKKLRDWPGIAESNPKLLARVKADIFVQEKLSVGSVAPEIVGTDHADEEFKLSDYRGKVVLLDFWGYW